MRIFRKKAGIPAFLVKIYAFSFLFMMFWAFLTRFPAFLLKVILMPASAFVAAVATVVAAEYPQSTLKGTPA